MNANRTREAPGVISELRAEIEKLPQDRGGKRKGISKDLKRRATTELLQSGMRLEEFAAAISVSPSALCCWRRQFGGEERLQRKVAGAGFKRLSVTPEESPPPGKGIAIEGPKGLRVTGLSAEALASVLRALC